MPHSNIENLALAWKDSSLLLIKPKEEKIEKQTDLKLFINSFHAMPTQLVYLYVCPKRPQCWFWLY